MNREHHRVDIGDLHLHVVTQGPREGPPLLLLHGFPEFWEGWSRQIDPIAEAGIRVVVPDLRGYNLSDKPSAVGDYRMSVLIRDVLGLIDWIGGGPIALGGHDWGGLLALAVAQQHPDRLDRLIVLNAPFLGLMWRELRKPSQLMNSSYILAFQLPWIAEWMIRERRFRRLRMAMYANSRKRPYTEAEIDRYVTSWEQPGAVNGMLGWYRAPARYPNDSSDLRRVTVPTKVIWGRRDWALGEALVEPTLALCDDANLVWVDDAGHFVQHDAPDIVNREIIAFMER
ncbi:MAG: alpha/beta hydrolase [Myxococcota bacterium]